MGHRAGWLALGAGIAGGADVILIPEIPVQRGESGQGDSEPKPRRKHFSIVAVAEGAMSLGRPLQRAKSYEKRKRDKGRRKSRKRAQGHSMLRSTHGGNTLSLAHNWRR